MRRNKAETDYQRMMIKGQWLSMALSDKLSAYDIRGIADEALRILQIDYTRKNYDPVVTTLFTLLEEHKIKKLSSVYKQEAWVQEVIKKHSIKASVNSSFLENVPAVASLPKQRNQAIEDTVSAITGQTTDHDTQLGKILRRIMKIVIGEVDSTLCTRAIILRMVRRLQSHPGRPWEYALSITSSKPGDDVKLLQFLLERYNDISDFVIDAGEKVSFVRRMPCQFDDKSLAGRRKGQLFEYVGLSSLMSRMFIDFLREGGQDYLSMCKYCGSFILAERKGRREFCNNTCGTAFRRMDKSCQK